MNVLDLFSGIGGFSLGLERAGMRTVAFCEIDPYCRAVLARHWPDVPVYGDIRDLTAARLVADAIGVRQLQSQGSESKERRRSGDSGIDVICGGFPCQDISVAGKGAGIAGERSGLWKEYARIIGELRPRYVIVENVAALLGRGLGTVLGDLVALGYDAEWHCIPATAVGAPHRRDRVWIVAYPARFQPGRSEQWTQWQRTGPGGEPSEMANPDQPRLSKRHVGNGIEAARSGIFQGRELERACATLGEQQWLTEPDVGRVAHGVPNRVDRLRSLGNAVVPQIPEIIGRAIMKAAGH